jgi:hypothetical protein
VRRTCWGTGSFVQAGAGQAARSMRCGCLAKVITSRTVLALSEIAPHWSVRMTAAPMERHISIVAGPGCPVANVRSANVHNCARASMRNVTTTVHIPDGRFPVKPAPNAASEMNTLVADTFVMV